MDIIAKLRDVSVIRGNGLILENINWTVRRGENWAVLGGNGSGKSFLLNVVSAACSRARAAWRCSAHGWARPMYGIFAAV